MANMRRSSCRDDRLAGIKQKTVTGMSVKKQREREKSSGEQTSRRSRSSDTPCYRAPSPLHEQNAASQSADLVLYFINIQKICQRLSL